MILFGSLVLVLRSERVQTAIVGALTEEISKQLHVEARIDRVSLRLPLQVQLENVYLSDQQGRPLLKVPNLWVRMSFRAYYNNCLRFPMIRLDSPAIYLVQDENSTNADFLIQYFQPKQPRSTFGYKVDCQQIVIDNARVHYSYLPKDMEIVVSNISTNLGLTYDEKQLQAHLRQLHVRAGMTSLDGYIEADLHGSLDTITADQLLLVYKNEPIFQGQVVVEQPLRPERMYTTIQCSELYATASIVASLLSDIQKQPFVLPSWTYKLGQLHYRGLVTGTMDDIALKGSLRTYWGTLTTQASLHNKQQLHAAVSTHGLQIGRYLHNPEVGNLSAACTVDMTLQDQPIVDLSAQVSALQFKNYTYSNLRCKAHYEGSECEGTLSMLDPNVVVSSSLAVRQIGATPIFEADMDVPRLDLAALHLTPADKGHRLSFRSSLRLQTDTTVANRADATVGSVRLDSLQVWGVGHRLSVPRVDVALTANGNHRHMHIQSSVLSASVDGDFQWSTLVASVQQALHRNLPSVVEAPKEKNPNNTMDFRIDVLQADQLFSILSSDPLTFTSAPFIEGYIHDKDQTFSVNVSVPELKRLNKAYQQLGLRVDNLNAQHSTTGMVSVIQHPISPDSTGFRIGDIMAKLVLSGQHDSLMTDIFFGPVAEVDSVPDICIQTTFAKSKGVPSVDVHVLPTQFTLGVADWRVKDSHVRYSMSDGVVRVDSLMFSTKQQMLMLDGCMSKSSSDSLVVQLKDVDLGYMLSATKVLDAVDLRGKMTGWLTLYSAFSTPQFEANLTMPNGTINGTDLGCVNANATLDRATGKVLLKGNAVRNNLTIADINGYVLPTQPAQWDVQIDADGMPLDFINFWTKSILGDVKGSAHGRVHLYGRNRRTWVTTRAYAQDAGVTIPATGARYYFSDSIFMDTASIAFPSVSVHDAEGHEGMLSGRILHSNFRNFRFKISATCNDLLAIDLPASSGSVYYGRAYANGTVSIQGDERQTSIDVDASTSENTDFYLSLATASSASSSEFITFRQPTLWSDTADVRPAAKPNSNLLLNLYIDVRPSARVHLVLDEHNGDGIVGRGEGNIRLNMDATTGEMQMVGAYTLRSGTFSYTVGNLVHRDFSIAEGSTVTWLGDATNPRLDVVAKYRCTASLRDLFGSDVKQVTSRPSIPVDCVIRISGEMNNMILKFGIEYPQSDESVAAQINSVINTEAMLMRQVIYLLVFNRFYTPEYMRNNTANASLNDAYSLLSSTVTGQINAWLSKLTSMVNVGFNMRYDSQSGNQSYETEANIQIQPVDRLTINGNVGYRYNDLTNQPIFGDADVEYELTADGKLRAKVFTHSVDKYSLHQSGMQEGVGFIFRHDFNPGDAKKRREQKKAEASK